MLLDEDSQPKLTEFPPIFDRQMFMSITVEFGSNEKLAASRLIESSLLEDLGTAGDITSRAFLNPESTGTVQIVSREPGVLAGIPIAEQVFAAIDSRVRVVSLMNDGAQLSPGSVVAEIQGPTLSLLEGERTVLNFLTHLSGIASLTARFVVEVKGTLAQILDTRKTLPGWRLLQKYAVRAGGGTNHRIGLYDAVLIKDNHLAAWKTANPDQPLAAALQAVRKRVPEGTIIEIEVDRLDQLKEALPGGPDIVLLDNMPPETMREAVAIRNSLAPHVLLEASGGVRLDSVAAIAATGVERISVGALTHSAPHLDLGLDWKN